MAEIGIKFLGEVAVTEHTIDGWAINTIRKMWDDGTVLYGIELEDGTNLTPDGLFTLEPDAAQVALAYYAWERTVQES